MKFNVNDKVRVRLTDRGRTIHRNAYESLRRDVPSLSPYRPPTEDQDGWSDWQLWYLMREFGASMFNGCEVPFQTTIDIVVKASDDAILLESIYRAIDAARKP